MSPHRTIAPGIPLFDLFQELRRSGIPLGIEELERALEALQMGLGGTTVAELRDLLKMVWLTSREEIGLFEPLFMRWLEVAGEAGLHGMGEELADLRMAMGSVPAAEGAEVRGASDEVDGGEGVPEAEPVHREKELQPEGRTEDARIELREGKNQKMPIPYRRLIRQHDPLSPVEARRAWQKLDIEEELWTKFELDLPGTVRRIARQGYFDAPVVRPQRIRSLNLILLLDRGGSMTPTHDFCDRWRRNLEASVRFRRIRTAYFHDTIRENVFLDALRNRPVPLHRLLRPFPPRQTAVLIVTDAGAARQNWDPARIVHSEKLSVRLRRNRFIQLWLNPFRPAYWKGNIAEEIAQLVPKMLPMDAEGTGQAIRFLNQQLQKREGLA